MMAASLHWEALYETVLLNLFHIQKEKIVLIILQGIPSFKKMGENVFFW